MGHKEGYIRSVTVGDRMTAIISSIRITNRQKLQNSGSDPISNFLIVIDQVTGLVSGDSVQIHYHLDWTQVS